MPNTKIQIQIQIIQKTRRHSWKTHAKDQNTNTDDTKVRQHSWKTHAIDQNTNTNTDNTKARRHSWKTHAKDR